MSDFVIQLFGILAMILGVLSFQFKTSKQIILCASLASLLFCINLYFLGGYTGALLNLVGLIRGLYFLKVKNPPKWIFFIVLGAVLGCYACTFTVFGVEPTISKLLLELCPVLAMAVQTYAYLTGNPKAIRYLSYFVSPAWLVYDIANHSIGAIICEFFAITSITISLIRYSKTKAEPEQTQEPNT